MIKYRIITAGILIPLVIGLIFFTSPLIFCVITGLVTLWAMWEWSTLAQLNKKVQRFYYLIFSYLLMTVIFVTFVPTFLMVIFLWWVIAIGLVVAYPRFSHWWGRGLFWRAIMGWLVVIPCWVTINFIRHVPHGPWMLCYLFVLIWGADMGAYFVGKWIGKHKLMPEVSPGKTWEGVAGALICGVIITLITLLWLDLPYAIWPWAMGLTLITVIFAVFGDLFESMLKRRANLKDSGTLLPGHGGILDRIDSLTAAAPVFALGTMLLGYII